MHHRNEEEKRGKVLRSLLVFFVQRSLSNSLSFFLSLSLLLGHARLFSLFVFICSLSLSLVSLSLSLP